MRPEPLERVAPPGTALGFLGHPEGVLVSNLELQLSVMNVVQQLEVFFFLGLSGQRLEFTSLSFSFFHFSTLLFKFELLRFAELLLQLVF